jgi:hypothetical protein
MNEHIDGEGRKVIAIPHYTDNDVRYPLTHFAIAVHLGITAYTEDNVAECLRRTKAFLGLYERMDKPLLYKRDDSPLLVEEIDEDFIRAHIGQKPQFGFRSPEDFDEHVRNVEASLTGVPRRTYRRITFLGSSRSDRPFQIFQEINDQYRSEARRVEVYPDGMLLWREDGEHGEGSAEQEFTETEDVPGPGIINDRTNQRCETVPAEEFEKLWDRALGTNCGWVVELKAEGSPIVPDDTESVYCTHTHQDESPFCPEHHELARRMFPALFV